MPNIGHPQVVLDLQHGLPIAQCAHEDATHDPPLDEPLDELDELEVL